METTVKIEYIETSRLKLHDRNPRKLKDNQFEILKKSLADNPEYFETRPILVNKDMVVFAGNMRLRAARALGMEKVPVAILDVSPEKEKELMIRDNRSNGEWDFDILASDFEMPELLDWGFEENELTGLFDLAEEKDDEVPEVPEVPKSKLGDLYELGNHRVLCGDSTKLEDVERLMDGKKADMVFTDPPYQLDTKGGGVLKYAKSMRGIEELNIGTFDPSCLESRSTTEVFCCNKPLVKQYLQLAEDWGKPYDICFYKKENTAPNYGGHLMTDTEYLIVIGQQAPRKGLPKETYSKAYIGKKDADNVTAWSKPVGLCQKFIQLYSDTKQIVADWYLGSGSTLIAAEKTGRICYGMELDPKYIDVIVQRYVDFTGNKKIRKNGEEIEWTT